MNPLSYSSLSAPMYKAEAHANKCFSLVDLPFVRPIYKAPVKELKRVVGKRIPTPPSLWYFIMAA